MKTKLFLFSLFVGLFYLVGCDDSLESIGSGVQPDDDKIEMFSATINLNGETVQLNPDSIYAKTKYGILGEYTHPIYGSTKGSYACQFYPSAEFYLDSMYRDEIDSIRLKIYYYSYVGDSLAPMEATVYPVAKPLEKSYYLDRNIEEYVDKNTILGSRTYTARNLNVSDSLNHAQVTHKDSIIPKTLTINLPKELGQQLYEEYKKGDAGAFASQEAFTEYFPGIYVEPTFGEGCILNVGATDINIYYQRKTTVPNAETGEDVITAITQTTRLKLTKEVIQLNSYTNDNKKLLEPNPDKMYLKAPAGVFSKITIPVSEIVDVVGNRKFNSVRLELPAYPIENSEYVWDFPGNNKQIGIESERSKLLLIEKDSIIDFFEQRKIADGNTSFFTTYNSSTQSYVYNNISNLLQNAMQNPQEDGSYRDLEMYLIPVNVAYYKSQDYYYNTIYVDYASSHYLHPAAVTLKKGGGNLKLKIIAADISSD